jgi:phasin family protein
MFGQFSEQLKKSSQPASELLAANVKALEAVTAQQSQFLSGLLEDSVKLMQNVAQQTEVKSILAAQSVYAESVRERFTSTSKNTYSTLNTVSKQYADTLKSGLETASEAAQETVQTAVAKVVPVTKPKAESVKAAPVKKEVKKAVKKTVKKATVSETASKASVAKKEKPVTAKKVSKAKSASPVETKKPVATTTAVKPATKSVAKPVATLSADEVRAPTKTKSTDVTSASTPATKA